MCHLSCLKLIVLFFLHLFLVIMGACWITGFGFPAYLSWMNFACGCIFLISYWSVSNSFSNSVVLDLFVSFPFNLEVLISLLASGTRPSAFLIF